MKLAPVRVSLCPHISDVLSLFLDSFTADDIMYKWKKENKTWSPNLEIAQFTLDSVTVQQKGKTYVTGTCDDRQGFFRCNGLNL